jgi:hypothetical protein
MGPEDLLRELAAALQQGQGEIPSVFDAFKGFAAERFPADQRDELLESAKEAFAGGPGAPQLPLAPGINLRWGLPDGSRQAWFVTVRDDDDPEGKAFFTIRVKPETAGELAVWCIHLQRIRVPGAKPVAEA